MAPQFNHIFPFLCIRVSVIAFGFFTIKRLLYINLYIHVCFQLLISYFQMHFKNLACVLSSTSQLLFLISYFASNCFVYPLTVYCGCWWFNDSSFNLPTGFVCGWFWTCSVSLLFWWAFSFYNFLCLIVAFSFLHREVPLIFVVKLVWWCWNPIVFACLYIIWFLHQI